MTPASVPRIRRAALSEHFCRESFEPCSMSPGVRRQARFVTRLLQKPFEVPAVFERDLRKKQSPLHAGGNHQPMPSEDDVFRPDRCERRQNAQRYPERRCLHRVNRSETPVFKRGRPCRLCNRAIERCDRQHIPDAPAQLALQIERRESSARLRQVPGGCLKRNGATFDRGFDGLVRNPQQKQTLFRTVFCLWFCGGQCGIAANYQVTGTSRFLRRVRTKARRRRFTTCRSILDQKAAK